MQSKRPPDLNTVAIDLVEQFERTFELLKAVNQRYENITTTVSLPLMRFFLNAINHASNTCIFGTTNIHENTVRTGGYISDLFQRSKPGCYISTHSDSNRPLWRFSPTRNGMKISIKPFKPGYHPLTDPHYKLSHGLKYTLENTLIASALRFGNCLARSELVIKFIWEHIKEMPEISCVELFEVKTFDHCFVGINIDGDLNHPETVNRGWIIDPWLNGTGIIYPAILHHRRIVETRDFMEQQYHLFGVLDTKLKENKLTYNAIVQTPILRFDPLTTPYPSAFSTIDTHLYADFLPNECTDEVMREAEKIHQENFRSTAFILKTAGTNGTLRPSFFRRESREYDRTQRERNAKNELYGPASSP